MLKVYSYFNSICTQKVFITLAEKGIDYATQNVDLFRNEQFSPEYLKINPKGVVPALDHDGRVVIESSLICEYLDDCFPSPRLVPQIANALRMDCDLSAYPRSLAVYAHASKHPAFDAAQPQRQPDYIA